jgi:ribosome biogenesis GTPase
MKGTVIKSTGSWYVVKDLENKFHKARLRGKFKHLQLKVTNPIAVGDLVEFDSTGEEDVSAVITNIYPRENYIIRQSVHKSNQGHLIASNISQTVLVATLQQPKTSLGFIDRFLVSAEAFRIQSVIVFNKTDIYTPEELAELQTYKELYSQLGYQIIASSSKTNEGIEALRALLVSNTTLFSGHSGVGKSTLLNCLSPKLDIRTSEISQFADKGVHTTTFAEMHLIDDNSFVIDSPGIKELGIFEIGNDELSHYFPEMRALIGECKFHNCKHLNEPNCAVIAQVKSGQIAESRYKSYLSMLANKETHR